MKTRKSPSLAKRVTALAGFLYLSLTISAALCPARSQTLSGYDRDRGRTMLNVIKNDLKEHYYDPSFRGIDLDARFEVADEKLKRATSNSQMFGIIAQVLIDFEDSHTFFLPPSRVARTDYGWQMQMIGDRCYVTAVKPKSDAEAKGLKVGDEIWTIDGFEPTRENLWKMKYAYYTLKPKAGMHLVVRKPDGQKSEFDVMAKVRSGKQITDLTSGSNEINELIREAEDEDRLHRHRYYEAGDDLFVWKMPQFDLTEAEVDETMSKVRKHKNLILDLRGNGGGAVLTLQRMVGHFFDHDLNIAELKGRKEMKPMVAKTRGDKVFKGKLVVLIDSGSGSASELFARVIQLEKRGVVIGDRSAGAVMQSKHYSHTHGVDIVSFYGVSITNADVIMSDGKSLEHSGVTPDELLLPTAADLAAGRDPVLARAAALVGSPIEPEKAGALFPVEWRK